MSLNIKEKQMAILLHEYQLLSKTVLNQLQNIDELIHQGIDNKTEDIESNELIIDRLELKIREEIIFSIFKFNPKASDLRLLISYQDAATNLERIADMLLNIAHILEREHSLKKVDIVLQQHLDEMQELAFQMVRDAIFIFLNENSELAYNIITKDNKVDCLFHQLNLLLQETFMQKPFEGKDVVHIINLTLISQNFERIADCATNIAESAIFITEGKDIRHAKKQDTDR